MAPIPGPDGLVECHCLKICREVGKRIRPGTWRKHNPSRSRVDPSVQSSLAAVLTPTERERLAKKTPLSSGTYFSSWPSRQAVKRTPSAATGSTPRTAGFSAAREDLDVQMDDVSFTTHA